ncbi:MAG: hypothetical protein DWQ05_03675 [Calditrichaeota bacterium]|nr:MAG: hypothetical protein DWQ05_03675 [Calditrichota bacterium]
MRNYNMTYQNNPNRIYPGSLIFLLLLLFSLPANSRANDEIIIKPHLETKPRTHLAFIPHYQTVRPKIGLAFSGGGANGISQVGVLQVLVENNIPIDYIVGTSMGCLIGGFYAAGYSPYEIEGLLADFDWSRILNDRPERQTLFIDDKQARDKLLFQIRFNGLQPVIPPAITPGQQIENLLTQYVMRANYVATQSFDELRIPFRAVSTDLITGKKVILKEGNLAEAMRASISFPLLFAPVKVGNMMLVDGGMSENIPVESVQEFPVDLVIAVDATTLLRRSHQLNAPWEIADQVTSIMQRDRNQKSRNRADFVILLQDSMRTNMEFGNIDSLVYLGRSAAAKHIENIKNSITQLESNHTDDSLGEMYHIGRLINFPPNFHKLIATHNPDQDNGLYLTKREIEGIVNNMHESGEFFRISAHLTKNENSNLCEMEIKAQAYPVLQAVRFHGNQVLETALLNEQVKEIIGQPIFPKSTESSLQNILKSYRKAGFALAQIKRVEFDFDTNTGDIYIDEGRINSIIIEGKHRTRTHVILRELPLHAGDVYNYDKAKKGINNIVGTGLFSRVSISLKPKHDGVDLYLKLQEKFSRVLSGAARFDLERRARGFLQMADENIAGLGGKLTLQGLFGASDNGLRARFSVDRIFKTYFTFAAESYWLLRERKTFTRENNDTFGKYDESRVGAFASVGQLFRRFGILSAELHIDQFNLTEKTGAGYPIGKFNINRLAFRSIVDTRDRLPFPQRGRFASFFYETSIKSGINNSSFVRTAWSIESYYTIKKRHTFHPKFSFGTSDVTTPFVFRYYFSGPSHMYGLRDEQWRGRHYVLWNFDYRYQLFRNFSTSGYLGVRYDLGGIWEGETEKLKYRDELKEAVGIYLGFRTFLGALKFSYGHLETGVDRFYFSLGYPL